MSVVAVYIFIGLVLVMLVAGNYIIYRRQATKALTKKQSFLGALVLSIADLFL